MGLTYVKMTISSLTKRKGKEVQHRFLIDSGAVFSVVPEEILKKLGIKPEREEELDFANGEVVSRKVGNARVT
jgi:predicted aspartyl protease